jgi:hypothetical protein
MIYNERNRMEPTEELEVVLGKYDTFDNNNLIWDHNFIVNGNYTLSDKFGVSFNVGATSNMKIMTDKVLLVRIKVYSMYSQT